MEINNHRHNQLLVVGSAGFIGQHVVKKSLKLGLNTTALSKNNCNAIDKLDGVTYLSADIRDKESLLARLEGKAFDYVINLAGYVDHANYSNGGSEVYDVHFNGVRNLVDCIDKSKIKGFVQIGSSDEYGNNPAPQSETQREAPISPYSCAKVASTHFLQTLFKTENFPSIILRPFLVYGPKQGMERLIPQIIKGCINNQKFPVSKGEQLRDFCFIDDFVQAVFLALYNSKAHGEVINIASGNPASVRMVISSIQNIIGLGCPEFGRVEYRNNENMDLVADISKARRILGWHSKTNLESGLRKTIKAHMQIV
jgi:nucleoside-diphosphate-sugar epimerase